MSLNNVLPALRIGSPLSAWKLLLLSAATSRPALRSLSFAFLRPFVHDGEVEIDWNCHGRMMRSFIRLSDLGSDLTSIRELGAGDTYSIDLHFDPDLAIDAGGNIGLFTLRTAAALQARNRSAQIVICEPLPRNVAQIKKHLLLNQVNAEIVPACIGGSRRTIPFYCREAINSSFDPAEPYRSVQEMPVYPLKEIVDAHAAERILIKMDIEGMETETLAAFLPGESRAIYIVGELHRFAASAPHFHEIFAAHGWRLEFLHVADDLGTFRACSPAAEGMLNWATTRLVA